MTTIHFFLPESDESFAKLPKRVLDYATWQSTADKSFRYWGCYHWVLQTYLYLLEAGLPVALTNRLPPAGLILTHRDFFDYGLRPRPEQTLVAMLVDREVPHPHAHLHITHNPVQRLPFGMASCFMPPWPQIGLIPRDGARGDRFESLGFFGYEHNLDLAIRDPAFIARLHTLGLRLEIPLPTAWHDFSGIDAVIAVRSFGRGDELLTKPSLKLFNAWMAGVPAILGHESAYRHDGSPGMGYLEATTPSELLACIQVLKDNPVRRSEIVEFGQAAIGDYTQERTVQRWRDLIGTVLEPLHQDLRANSVSRFGKRLRGNVLERILWRRPGRFVRQR